LCGHQMLWNRITNIKGLMKSLFAFGSTGN
jgi:hypothetical protein